MTEVSFRGPVSTAVTIEHMHGDLLTFAPPETQLEPKAWLALTLLNRQPQLNAVTDRLEAIIESRAGGTLLVILPGVRLDFHQSFVVRCGLAHFVENYDNGNGWRYLGRLQWPHGARSVEPILKTIKLALPLPKEARKQRDIEAHLATWPKSLCFSHYIDGDSWDDRQHQLVLKWIKYVSGEWPAPTGCLVVAFLCIYSGTNSNEGVDRFIQETASRTRDNAQGAILVTDPLDLVGVNDVDDWIGEVGRWLCEPTFDLRLWNATEQIFAGPNDRQRYGEVFKKLCGVLAGVLAPATSFTKATR